MRRGLTLTLVLVLGCACEGPPLARQPHPSIDAFALPAAIASAMPSELHDRFRKTTELGVAPTIVPAVNALADFTRFEAATLGPANAPSHVYAAYRALATSLTEADAVRLLQHVSPVVRSYMVVHLLENAPQRVPAVYGLLDDETRVDTIRGRVDGMSTVALETLTSIGVAAPTSPLAATHIVLAAADGRLPPLVRAQALARAAGMHRPEAHDLVISALDAAALPLRQEALRTIGSVGTEGDVPALVRFTTAKDASFRRGVAQAFGELPCAASKAALETLITDADDPVKRTAAHAYALQPDADKAIVTKLLGDREPEIADAAASGLVSKLTDDHLALLGPWLHDRVKPTSEILHAIFASPTKERIPFFRSLVDANDETVRTAALDALGAVGDTASNPAMRKALRAASLGERETAAKSAAKLGDKGAAPLVAKLLDESDSHARVVGAEALVTLRAKSYVPELDEVAHKDTSWSRRPLLEALAALREGRDLTPPAP